MVDAYTARKTFEAQLIYVRSTGPGKQTRGGQPVVSSDEMLKLMGVEL